MDLQEVKLKDVSFKTAFKATLGFYVAQTVATFIGLVMIIGVTWLVAKIFFA